MEDLKIPTEVVSVTAAPQGHVILGMVDRQGDTAAVVLDIEQIRVLATLIGEAYSASLDGREYFKGMARPVLERPEASSLN